MVTTGRSFEGSLPLERMSRLKSGLAHTEGDVAYSMQFGRDALGIAYLALHAQASLPLVCQRTLESFVMPVVVDTRLGLIENENDEAALPGDYEALLLDHGHIHPADVIEDELLLALPLIAVKPGSSLPPALDAELAPPTSSARTDNPFAVLGELKKQ